MEFAVQRLRTRQEFLALRESGKKFITSSMIIQHDKKSFFSDDYQVGLTVSSRNGNAVTRNRIRRRLREAIRQVNDLTRAGFRYNLIARPTIVKMPFAELVKELRFALGHIHRKE